MGFCQQCRQLCILACMIDLHTHSNVSDGELSPTALLELAKNSGITALALTDHDTLAGLEEAEKIAKLLEIRFIPGVESEVEFEPGDFHILGLGIKQYPDGPLGDFLEEIRRRRNSRNSRMVHLMNADGLNVTLNELNSLAGGEVLGRMHFASWLIAKGMAKNVPDCFEKWLRPGCPYNVPKISPKLEEFVEVIRKAGGKAIIAHPLSLWISWSRFEKYAPLWKEIGIDGIEALHSGASRSGAAKLAELAKKNDMLITGGSDFHGSGRPDRRLGYGAAGISLNEELLLPFDEA